jgi:hypothetical protein
MHWNRILGVISLIVIIVFILLSTSCFGTDTSSTTSTTSSALKPQPKVESVIATTSGTETAYFTTLDIKVRNDGAEGTILVVASVTQNGTTNQNKMPVFLKKGENHELKMTFPLVWGGGEFTSNVQTTVP